MTPTTTLELHSGDHLTRDEFERRYAAMHDRKAELIEGVVYVASPVSDEHAKLDHLLQGWLMVYASSRPGWHGRTNGSVRLDERNQPQPDLFLARTDHPTQGKFLVGAPPLICEVAYTSAAIDLHDKLEVYGRHDCREYVVVVADPFEVFWFVRNEAGALSRVEAENGIHRSREFPGLWLDVEALRRLDGAGLLATLQRGIGERPS